MAAKGRRLKPTFFATPDRFRVWFQKNHESLDELWVGFHKRATGKPSMTWPQAVDEALCFGWIDGLRKSVDETSYMIRFTPRRAGSIWSAVNIARAKELSRLGLMSPAGLKAFAKRTSEKSAIYSYEQRRNSVLDPSQLKEFRANERAWAFFSAQAPSYRRVAIFWIASAKKADTKARRLEILISSSAAGRRLGPSPKPVA